MASASSKNTVTVLAILVVVLLGAVGFLTYKVLNPNPDIVMESPEYMQLENEKDSMENEFENLIAEYEAMKTSNDTLNAKLVAEQQKIETMMQEMKKVKVSNSYKLKQYEQELTTLRKIMRGYIVQLDSLNTLNQELIAENTQVKQEYSRIKNESEELANTNEQLNSKVSEASRLTAQGFTLVPLSDRDKVTSKADKLMKFKVCFTINANNVAEPGFKNIYLRVSDPGGRIMAPSATNLFNFNGKELIYSAKQRIEYNNKAMDACAYWTNDRDLTAGKYAVDVFIESYLVGSVTVFLN